MEINPQKEIEKIINFIKKTFQAQNFQKGIVAVSGGLDSTVCLALAVKALGNKNIYSLQIPYKRQPVDLSNLIIKKLHLPVNNQIKLKLSRSVDKLAVKLNVKKNPLRFGNILARARMICLFDQAKAKKALVIGTENKSEKLLGYYTRYGDQASDIDLIFHLYKTQVYALAKHLNIPKPIIDQSPSAGLWLDQTDQKELGFSYQKADQVLQALETNKSLNSFDQNLVKKIKNHLKAVDFKQKVPYHL